MGRKDMERIKREYLEEERAIFLKQLVKGFLKRDLVKSFEDYKKHIYPEFKFEAKNIPSITVNRLPMQNKLGGSVRTIFLFYVEGQSIIYQFLYQKIEYTDSEQIFKICRLLYWKNDKNNF